MGLDPLSMGMIGVSGFQAYQSFKAGSEAKASYYEAANEELRQASFEQQMGMEKLHDLAVEEGRQVGGAKSAAAGKGLRVAGSVATLTDAISGNIRRRKFLLGREISEGMRRRMVTAGQYRKAGRTAKKAADLEGFGSLLTGGVMVAKRLYRQGKKLTWNQQKAAMDKPDYYDRKK